MDKETYIKYLKDYLHLISLYLNKKEEPSFKIDESNFNIFLNLSKKHSLTALFYKVVKDTKVDIKEEYLKVLEQYYFSNVQKHVLFEQERKELFWAAAKARNKLPPHVSEYVMRHRDAILILEIMEKNNMNDASLKRVVKFMEEIENAENG